MTLWNEIVESVPTKSQGVYVGTQQYDDEEMLEMVGRLSEKTGVSPEDLMSAFGHYLFPKLAEWAPSAMKDIQSFKHLLLNIDSIIHFEVRRLYPDAYVPLIESKEIDEGVELKYISKRRLTKVMEGLIKGAADYFDTQCSLDFLGEAPDAENTFVYIVKTS